MMVSILLLSSIALGSQSSEPTAVGQTLEQAAQPDPLSKTPVDLPRAQPGRWAELLDGQGPEHFAQYVAAKVIDQMLLAEQFYKRGQYPSAVEQLWQVLSDCPDFPPALSVLGTTYFRLRRYGDTAECFERFLAHAPSAVWRTQALGHAYHSLGRFEAAIAHYDRVLAELPDSVEAIRGRALSSLRLGRSADARAGFERIIELDPDHFDTLCELAQLDLDQEHLEAARAHAEHAKTTAPHEPRAWFLLSRILFELGEESAAEETLRRWKELDSLAQQIRNLEGRLLYGENRYGLALALVELQRRVGDRAGVRRSLDIAIQSIPPEVDALDVFLFALDTLHGMGDRDAAIQAAQAIEQNFADSVEAWRALEDFWGDMRDRQRQIEAGERALRLGSPNDF